MNPRYTEETNRQPAFLLVLLVLAISTIVVGRSAISLITDVSSVESVGSSPVFVFLTLAGALSLVLITYRWIFHLVLLMIPSRAAPKPNSDVFVSAVVPAFNEEQGIRKTMKSLAGQDYKNMEILVIDDGSKEGTRIGPVRKSA